jgi:AraC family transcriptional regulator
VDWHYHENPYFTFILQGNVMEGNKKETFNCGAGTLLFHNWHEAHYNVKPKGFTRGFHIELEKNWFNAFEIDTQKLQGNINVDDPAVKTLMYNIFKESKSAGCDSSLAVDALLIELFGQMAGAQKTLYRTRPAWVNQIKELLNDGRENRKLYDLANSLNIHPVHLSRDFRKYFNCNLGDYIRAIRLQNALTLLPDETLSLTDIALQCCFADQSHFIRSFKALYNITPSQYRNMLLKKH